MKVIILSCFCAILIFVSSTNSYDHFEEVRASNCSSYDEEGCIAIQSSSDCEWCGDPGAACIDNSTSGCCSFSTGGAIATWENTVLAKDPFNCLIVEGNYYFPPESVNWEYFILNEGYHTHCPWKGLCSYYNVTVTTENPNCAWSYMNPFWAAQDIQNYVAFWENVTVTPIH